MSPTGAAAGAGDRVPIDQATRDLVSRDGLGRTLFVEAGAGTGKTTQLVERIANLVLHEGVRLLNVAAITFTEAAAAELQARIRVKFEQRAAETDGDERRRCLDALADADLAAISTLHGFASRLLNEFAVDAGLPPRVRVLDEVSSQLAHEDRWAHFVDRLYDDPANEALLERAQLVGVALEPRYQGHATFKDVAAELNDNWDRLGPVATLTPPPVDAVDFTPFDAAVGAIVDVAEQCDDPTDKFYRHLVDDLIPDMVGLAAEQDPDRKLQLLAGARGVWGPGNGGRKDAWGGDVVGAKAHVKAVNEATEAIVGDAADVVLRNLLVLVASEVLAAARERQEEGGLEFHDLLVLAREMLRTSAEARSGLHERYTHILLDEFQDTDPIQIELAMRIAASITGGEGAPWQELDVDDGRLFFVGDPKQSIYRFRRADIELFLHARDRFGPDGTWARLTTNFRTVAPVLDWVNAYFSSVMAQEQAGKQPRYEPLSPWRDPSPGGDHRPVLLGGPHADPKVKAGELRTIEAASVAALVADVGARPEAWPVHDDATDEWRPAQLRDVTILVPTRTSVPYLRAALEDRGIPYRLATGTLVYDTQEVRDALAALRAVDDPTNELALVAALRSPLYACSDVDLFTFRRAGGRWDYRRDPVPRDGAGTPGGVGVAAGEPSESLVPPTAAPPEPADGAAALDLVPPQQLGFDLGEATVPVEVPVPVPVPVPGPVDALTDDHPVVAAMAHLRSLWEQRWWQTPSAMLERLLRERRAFLLGFGDPRPTEVWRRLRFLVDQARAFEEAGGGDLRAFLEWAALQGVDGAKVHEPLLPETDDDALQILTIHGAKGLEFPIAVLSGMTTRTASPRTGVSLVWTDDQPEVRMRKGLATANHEPRYDLELEMDAHEKVRLLYVATTRARDHLVVSAHHKATTRPDTYASLLWAYFAELPELWRPVDGVPVGGGDPVIDSPADPAVPSLVGVPPVGAHDRAAWIDERESLLAPHHQPSVVSATAVARSVAVGGVLDEPEPESDDEIEAGIDGEDGVGSAVPQRRQGRAGSAIGRAVHATLQIVDFDEPVELEAQVRRQCELEAIDDLADRAIGLVRAALASDAVRLAARSPHHRELYVAAPIGDRVIEGYIDLLIETPDGLVVIDYKTDSANTEAEIDAKLATYELQGAAYAAALEATTGLTVIDCRFVFCRPGGAVERAVPDLRGAIARVHDHLGASRPAT